MTTATTPPLISIVTPCLNAESTIERTLESVRKQNYPRIQHVVVDGGSTDRTLEILADWPGIDVLSEPDRGLSDALNKGLKLARGDVVGWLNADDLYLPNALWTIARAYEAHSDAYWLSGLCVVVDGEDREIRRFVTWYKSVFLRHYRLSTLLVQNYVSAPATFLTRRGIEAVGEARLDLRYSMDYDLWLHAARRGAPVVIPTPIAAFRMVEGTLSMSGFEQQFAEHARVSWEHARGIERTAAALNVVLSRLIVMIYRALAARRRSA